MTGHFKVKKKIKQKRLVRYWQRWKRGCFGSNFVELTQSVTDRFLPFCRCSLFGGSYFFLIWQLFSIDYFLNSEEKLKYSRWRPIKITMHRQNQIRDVHHTPITVGPTTLISYWLEDIRVHFMIFKVWPYANRENRKDWLLSAKWSELFSRSYYSDGPRPRSLSLYSRNNISCVFPPWQ